MIQTINLGRVDSGRYAVSFSPPVNISDAVELSYFEAIPEEFERLLMRYVDDLKRRGEKFIFYLSNEFLDIEKSPIAQSLRSKGEKIVDYLGMEFLNMEKNLIVNLVRGILEDRVE